MYDQHVTVFIGTRRQSEAYLRRVHKDFENHEAHCTGETRTVKHVDNEHTWREFYIWCGPDWNSTPYNIAHLSHELLHVALHVLDRCDIRVSFDDHEVLTYYHSYLLREFLKQMKRSEMQSDAPSCYFRPRTRGDLVRALHAGTPCEVVADNESTTRILIDGWLNPPPYTVRPSENAGWVVFERDNDKGEVRGGAQRNHVSLSS